MQFDDMTLAGLPWDDSFPVWPIPPGVRYLNHGSFGPSPFKVSTVRANLSMQLERNPMDFFVRQLGDRLEFAYDALAKFVGCESRDLVFVDNATVGMNLIANSIPLSEGDEVLLTNHEYGAVLRIWRERCAAVGAKTIVQALPETFTTQEALVDQFWQGVNERTKVIVASHVTSPTAVVLPVKQICERAKKAKILSVVDGPHAVAMLPLNLRSVDADYYTASCHKWLCAPFGSGFLYVRRKHQQDLRPVNLSWGRSLCGKEPRWQDELDWMGTRDPAAFLTIPAAIEFLENEIGLAEFRLHGRKMVRYARERLEELGLEPVVPNDPQWQGTMLAFRLPEGAPEFEEHPSKGNPLQHALWEQHQIELLVNKWNGRTQVRVSCHSYTTEEDVDVLCSALKASLKG